MQTVYQIYCPAGLIVDRVLFISNQDPTTDVQETIATTKGFKHLRFDEFRASLMDFSSYLHGVAAKFEAGGLDQFYIMPKALDIGDLEAFIDKWIEEESSQPIAVLAGYGMGKTSFSKRIGHKYAKACLKGEVSRIPILIELGELSHEQSLKGLICLELTSGANGVGGFNYDLFMALHRQGQFLVILDGFDEMKHAMSYDEFETTFHELNQLVIDGSKVLLLGRPSAFSSEDEKQSVLHGVDHVSQRTIGTISTPNYREIELSNFTLDQAREFLSRFLHYQSKKAHAIGNKRIDGDFIERRIQELIDNDNSELIARPVHAQMLAEIAIEPDIELTQMNRHELYRIFISVLIKRLYKREYSKAARRGLDTQKRLQFIQSVAWHFWKTQPAPSFTVESIPDELISPFALPESKHDHSAVCRELLTGSILESKGNARFYFPHRSFQEYLVAKYVQAKYWQPEDIGDLGESLNQEILEFILESGDLGFVSDLVLYQKSFSEYSC